jgi:hypothetical protein
MKHKMKRYLILVVCLFANVIAYGQENYAGKIKSVPNPCLTVPCLPNMVLALDVDTANFVISVNGYWIITGKIVWNGIEHREGDTVEVEGVVSIKQDSNLNNYYEIEILSVNGVTNDVGIEKYYGISKCVLSQNSPNPFNKSTTIKYQFPAGVTNAKICIYDLQGKQLQCNPLKATQGEIEVKSSALKSGIYVYSLIVNDKTIATKRMVLTE